MMELGPFARPGRFWRGNLHTHSTRSDGHLTPEALCEVYRRAGYDFLAISDHYLARYGYPLTDASASEGEGFVTIRAAELHAGRIGTGEFWHLLGVGLPADFDSPMPEESGPELAARALAAGAFVAALHPAWYGVSVAEVESLGPVHAVEIWNATCADLNDRADSRYVLDQLLERGGRYFALACDDAHFTGERDDGLQASVWVRSETLEPSSLVAALKAGAYYSSTGPKFRTVGIDEPGRLIVRCSPVKWVFASGRGPQVASAHGRDLTEVTLDISGLDSPYTQIALRDADGRRAWSNPIWLGADRRAPRAGR